MIKESVSMISETRNEMRGGKGNIDILHIFDKDEIKGGSRLFARITINPGCSIGMHEHAGEEEIYYILSGKALINDNGTVREIKAGDAVMTGGGASHSIENTGNETLELIATVLLFSGSK